MPILACARSAPLEVELLPAAAVTERVEAVAERVALVLAPASLVGEHFLSAIELLSVQSVQKKAII